LHVLLSNVLTDPIVLLDNFECKKVDWISF